MSSPSSFRGPRMIFAALLLALLATVLFLRSCRVTRSVAPRSVGHSLPDASSPAPIVNGPLPTSSVPVPSGSALQAAGPETAPGSGTTALTFRFQQGLLTVAQREHVADVQVRPLRRIEGVLGLYHRIVGPAGEVLFENIVPDPRKVPWDTSDDGRTLRGGVAHIDEIPVQLRLPAGVHGRLQIFTVESPEWTRSNLDKTGRLVADFSL